ncbi:MAG TPA: flavin reductase family protein [Polyangiaceae bacterium]|jgi:flavin reductase (DIM6/NTAB) family NADH-FMN oxidoreductase RutF|nr:flavin reductase family protein [Polyangiaceae bacterium]
MDLDPELFKRALRAWPSGVTVVTAVSGSGFTGMTASSFTSVSLSPPMVSVCVDVAARTLEALRAQRRFAISVLASDQAEASRRFASRRDDAFKFETPTVDGANGCPLIADASAHLECDMAFEHAAGDHIIVVGVVTRAVSTERAPLVYWNGQYGGFAPLPV